MCNGLREGRSLTVNFPWYNLSSVPAESPEGLAENTSCWPRVSESVHVGYSPIIPKFLGHSI